MRTELGPVAGVMDLPVVELRRYTLHPGARETLIELFDRELVEPQEEAGMTVLGQFRDLDDPDAFVWLRGFPDMPARAAALAAFYGGRVWRRHSRAANATMIDSDDVLLLRPGCGFPGRSTDRPPPGATAVPAGLLVATTYHLDPVDLAAFAAFFAARLVPALAATGTPPLAWFVTEPAANTFPALPVREGESVLVSFARFAGVEEHQRHAAALADSAAWAAAAAELGRRVPTPPTVARLTPTARSALPAATG
jgi:hypothetical protein